MLNKQGQITVFVIVGIVILFLIGIGAALFDKADSKNSVPIIEQASLISSEVKPIDEYITSCLNEVSNDAIQLIGIQAGYYQLPTKAYYYDIFEIPYYYFEEDVSQMLSKQQILANIGTYIENNLDYCFNFEKDFPEFDITTHEKIIKVTNHKDTLKFSLDMKTELNADETIKKFGKFETKINYDFDKFYNVMNEIMTNIMIDPYYIQYSLLLEIMESNEIQIDMIQDDSIIVYILEHDEYPFIFAIKLQEENNIPEFKIPNLEIKVGQELYHQIEAYDREGDSLEYEAYTTLFGVQSITGEFYFTPSTEDVGTHNINFSVSDGIDTVYQNVIIKVIP